MEQSKVKQAVLEKRIEYWHRSTGWNRMCYKCPLLGSLCVGSRNDRWHDCVKMREREFIRYPKYKNSYLMAFAKMIELREQKGLASNIKWANARPIDIFNWWMDNGILNGQYNLFEDYEDEED